MNNEFEVQRSLGRIEGGISEVKTELSLLRTDHAGLRAEFNKLEAGRLTRLESDFASYQAVAHAKSKSTAMWAAMWTSIIVGVLVSIISAAIIYSIFKVV